ncbi:MAG: cytochrome b/b6 domain-containing protein [Chloroflexi bacterium]|nr:cytochrome b/b6 domain-containing protein [Chloroflexota bacterium]
MQEVERYSKRAIVQHWWIVACSILLAITGLFLFISWFGPAAWWGYSRLVHRIAAVGFVAVPVLYMILNPKSTIEWVKEAFTWGKADFGWLKAAPTYYFGFDIIPMPPQERSNTGQKMWVLVVIVTSVIFVVSGGIMWFGKGLVSTGVFQWSVFAHDAAFVIASAMFLVHIALGTFHPRFSEALRSMISGKVSVHYAQSHHGKWYDRISGGKKE